MTKRHLLATLILGASTALVSPALANGLIQSVNGFVQIGINDDGSINAGTAAAGTVGIGYNFTGQGGRVGFQDALTPGCLCEAWGVAANGSSGHVGQVAGNVNISVALSSGGTNANAPAPGPTPSFTSNTSLSTVLGLTVTQAFSIAIETATGALFKDVVTLHNGTGVAITDLRFARAMDWDVPPSEFNEFVTHKGTTTTTTLLRSTDNGFASADPITDVADGGIIGPIDADGTTGPADHGSLFIFGFGGLADNADYTFNIFYGAGANELDALALLAGVSPELYSLGQSNSGGTRQVNDPTFVFAFSGVGGTVVTPEPASIALLGVGLLGLAALRRKAA